MSEDARPTCYVVEGLPEGGDYGTVFLGHFHRVEDATDRSKWVRGSSACGAVIRAYDAGGKEIGSGELGRFPVPGMMSDAWSFSGVLARMAADRHPALHCCAERCRRRKPTDSCSGCGICGPGDGKRLEHPGCEYIGHSCENCDLLESRCPSFRAWMEHRRSPGYEVQVMRDLDDDDGEAAGP